VKKDGEVIGDIELYFQDSSEMNRKYYTVIREHGMKICEYRINKADKAFSAIAVIRGERINTLLSELENAAHDTFVTSDEDMDLNPEALKALRLTKEEIEEYIISNTRIDDGEDQTIDGLYDMLAIPGFTPKITKKDPRTSVRRNKVNKKKKREPNANNPKTPTLPTPSEPKIPTEPKKRKVKTEQKNLHHMKM
jgi:hypothetical protein